MMCSMAKEFITMTTEKPKNKKVNLQTVSWKARELSTTMMDQKNMKANGAMTATKDKARIITQLMKRNVNLLESSIITTMGTNLTSKELELAQLMELYNFKAQGSGKVIKCMRMGHFFTKMEARNTKEL